MVRHPLGGYIVYPLPSLDVTIAEYKLIISKLSSVCKRKYAQLVPKSASQVVLGRMVAQPPCDSTNTSRRFALGARDVCLVGESPTCSVPVLYRCEGLLSCDYGYA